MKRWRTRTIQANTARYLEEYCNKVCFRMCGDVYLKNIYGFYCLTIQDLYMGMYTGIYDEDVMVNIEDWKHCRMEKSDLGGSLLICIESDENKTKVVYISARRYVCLIQHMEGLNIEREQETRVQERDSTCITASEYAAVMVSIVHLSVDQIINSHVIEFQEMIKGCTPEEIAECKKVRRKGRNRLATQRLRQRKTDLIDELKEKLSEKRREGREWQTKMDRAVEARNRMLERQNWAIEEVLRSHGLNNQTHTIEIVNGSANIARRVVYPFLQSGEDDLQENSFKEGDNEDWLEFSKRQKQK